MCGSNGMEASHWELTLVLWTAILAAYRQYVLIVVECSLIHEYSN